MLGISGVAPKTAVGAASVLLVALPLLLVGRRTGRHVGFRRIGRFRDLESWLQRHAHGKQLSWLRVLVLLVLMLTVVAAVAAVGAGIAEFGAIWPPFGRATQSMGRFLDENFVFWPTALLDALREAI